MDNSVADVENVVSFSVRNLPDSCRADAAQLCRLSLLQHRDAWDPSRAGWPVYSRVVCKGTVASFVGRELRHPTTSLDQPVNTEGDGGATMLDNAPSPGPDPEQVTERHEIARKALAVMKPAEREIISSYFGLRGLSPMTLQEIAESRGLTRAGMGYRIKRALDRARLALLDRP